MGDRTGERPSVRRVLAARTRQAHERLHVHPWISLLAAPSLTEDRYRIVLEAYLAFFAHVESARDSLDILQPLSLSFAIEALESDVAALHGDTTRRLRPHALPLDEHPSILGALYVLHGSAFGNRVLNGSVRDSLPHAPRDYLGAVVPSSLWKRLEAELEVHRDDDLTRDRLARGAIATFDAFARFVSRHCEGEPGTSEPESAAPELPPFRSAG